MVRASEEVICCYPDLEYSDALFASCLYHSSSWLFRRSRVDCWASFRGFIHLLIELNGERSLVPLAVAAVVVQASLYDVPGGFRAVMFDRFSGVKDKVRDGVG